MENSALKNDSKRETFTDFIKVVACYMVVLEHTAVRDLSTINDLLILGSCNCVLLFFMVNGYLMQHKDAISYHYSLNKIWNILKIILGWNVIVMILYAFIKHEFYNPITETIRNLLNKGFFWQLWFMGALILIYLILPIVFIINKKYHKQFLAFLILITVVIDSVSLYKGFPIYAGLPMTVWIWIWLLYFELGGALYKIKNRIIRKMTFKTHIVLCIIFFTASLGYNYCISEYVFHSTFPTYYNSNIFILIWTVLLFLLFYRLQLSYNVNRYIQKIATATWGIYLIHILIVKGIEQFYSFQQPFVNDCITVFVFIVSYMAVFVIKRIPGLRKLISY